MRRSASVGSWASPTLASSTVSEVINIGIDPLFLRQIIAQMELDVGQVELIPQFQTRSFD